jgi:PAS domain S-box-containing protein
LGRLALSNITGFLLLTPVIVAWASNARAWFRGTSLPRIAEAGLLGVLVLTVGWWTFSANKGSDFVPALVFLPLPLLLWAAVRFGPEGAGTAVLGVAVVSLWGAMAGKGPFVTAQAITNVTAMQFYWLVLFMAKVPLAIVVRDRGIMAGRAQESEGRLALALGAGRMGVWDWDFRTNSVHWSSEHFTIMGLPPFSLEPTYQTWAERVCPSDLPHAEAEMRTAIAEKKAYRCSYRIALPDGRVAWVEASGQPMYDETGQCFRVMGLLVDVTERKQAEEANRNAAHASRLAAMGELTAMIAHEVNQPLCAILANAAAAEILLESSEPRLETIRQILKEIRHDDERASKVVERIRDLVQKRDIEMEPLALNEIISDVLQFVGAEARQRHVDIQTELEANLPPISADKVHLQQVLLNLVLNGMEAMAEVPLSKRRLAIRTWGGSDSVELVVEDSGPGIPPEKLPLVFQSFFTTKKGGIGLGLSVARTIIERHDGRIWAENNPHGGAVFRIYLPAGGEPTRS